MTDLETLSGASERVISQRISDLIKELGYSHPVEHEAIEKALLKLIPPLEELFKAREALRFYADEWNWRVTEEQAEVGICSHAHTDRGKRAFEALGRVKGE